MKNLYFLTLIIIFSFQSFASENKPWFGSWKVTKLICPFDCPTWKSIYDKEAKGKAIEFAASSATSLEVNCKDSVEWSGVEKTKAGTYLHKWSDNAQAIKQPKIRKKLPSLLGLKPDTPIQAGIATCGGGEAFNLISVSANKAFLLSEENAYFQLSR